MTVTPDANTLLMGGGGDKTPALRLGPGKVGQPVHSQPGEYRGGKIVAGPDAFPVMKRDNRGNITNEQATFESGDKIWGVVVTVQTNERDPGIEGDDGRRRLYIDGPMGKDDRLYNSRRRAVRTAVEEADAPGLQIGGEIYMAWTKQVDTGAPSPAIDWVAKYVSAGNAALGVAAQAAPAPFDLGQWSAQRNAQQAVQPTVQQPAQVAPQSSAPAAQPAAMAAFDNLTDAQKQQLLAMAGLQQQPAAPPF